MPTLVELEVPASSDHLALVRLVVECAVTVGARLPDRKLDDLRLAVSEGCANALDAQRAAGSEAPILVRVDTTEGGVAVTITDHAGGFEPADVRSIPPATDPHRLRHERGLGIPIMRALVDEIRFTPTHDGTEVRLLVRG